MGLSKSYVDLCRLSSAKRIIKFDSSVQKLFNIISLKALDRYGIDGWAPKVPKMAAVYSSIQDLFNDIYIVILIFRHWFFTDFQSFEWTYDNIVENHSFKRAYSLRACSLSVRGCSKICSKFYSKLSKTCLELPLISVEWLLEKLSFLDYHWYYFTQAA